MSGSTEWPTTACHSDDTICLWLGGLLLGKLLLGGLILGELLLGGLLLSELLLHELLLGELRLDNDLWANYVPSVASGFG